MDHEETLQKIKGYILLLEAEVPPMLQNWEEHFPFSPSSEKGLGILLLYSSLLQGISEKALASWVQKWYELLGDSLLEAQSISYESLYTICSSVPGFANWELSGKAVGIVRSVGDFIQQTKQGTKGGWSVWMEKSYGTEDAVQELAKSIFYMGKRSLTKPKPRTFFWFYTWIIRGMGGEEKPERELFLPITAGGRSLMRAIQKENSKLFSSWIPHGYSWEAGSVEELQAYNQMVKSIFPKESWKVQYPISLYKRRGMGTLYKCQEWIGGCDRCPMDSICNKRTPLRASHNFT